MTEQPSSSDGFSTLEILIAFVVLSLGLTLAAQTVIQASNNIRAARERGDERRLVQAVLAEEVPDLLKSYAGRTLRNDSAQRSIEIVPLSGVPNLC